MHVVKLVKNRARGARLLPAAQRKLALFFNAKIGGPSFIPMPNLTWVEFESFSFFQNRTIVVIGTAIDGFLQKRALILKSVLFSARGKH